MKTLVLNMKIRTKFIVAYVVVILFTIAFNSFLTFNATKQVMIRHARNQGNYLSEQLAQNLSNQLKTMEELQFFQFYYSLLGNLLDSTPIDSEDRTVQTRKIDECLKRLCYSQRYIDGVCVIDSAGNIYAVNPIRGIDARDSIADIDLQEIAERRGKPVWSVGEGGSLLMSRRLINVNNTREVGNIVMLINPGYITQIYEKNASNLTGRVVLFDGNNRVLPSGFSELDEVAENYITLGLPEDNITYAGKEYIITRAKLPDKDFTLLNILAAQNLSLYTQGLPYTVLLTALVAILAAVLVAGGVSRLVTGNIKTLEDGIRKFASGSLNEPVKVNSGDEIGFLAVEFNKMTNEINSLINDVYNAEINRKNAELNALRFEYSALESKINPHFIYNTLESVNSLAKIKGESEISEMVCLLGSLLRDNISSSTDFIALENELENIRKYITIQKLTYGNKFEADIHVAEGAEAALVPKFILQPLVENAILHGILAKRGKGMITLKAEMDGANLRVVLSDDGAGISGDELNHILDYSVEAKNDSGTHAKVGVRTVDKRLKIIYGNDYGLFIESDKGNGTRITMSIPLQFGPRK